MKNKYLTPVLSTILCCGIFSTASALTFVNNYSESSEIMLSSLTSNNGCNVDSMLANEIMYFKLYEKKSDDPIPSVTLFPKDFSGNEVNKSTVCVYLKHPGHAYYTLFKKVDLKDSENCELLINEDEKITAGPGCVTG